METEGNNGGKQFIGGKRREEPRSPAKANRFKIVGGCARRTSKHLHVPG